MAKLDPEILAHLEWIGFVRPTGLVVSAPALVRAGAILDRRDIEGQRLLRGCAGERLFPGEKEPAPWVADFPSFAESVLGWSFSPKGYAGTTECPVPPELEVPLPDYGETLRPDFAVRELEPQNGASPWQLVVRVLEAGQDFDRVVRGNGQLEASPHGRMERLLRQTGVPAGLLFNGRALRLLSAPHGESSGWVDFRVADMVQTAGRPISTALRLLLGESRLLSLPHPQRLAALLEDSRKFQNEVSERLAEQVLHALYELLRGFQAAHDASGGELLRSPLAEHPDEVYRALLTVILRLVFLLFAEERDMLPEDETFLRYYSLAGLHERLREDAALYPDTMDQRYGAWTQLVALFRVVHDGAESGAMHIPKRHGVLFDPDRFKFLEGRAASGPRQIHERIDPPLVPDGTVYRALEKLLVLDGERISYRALDVEQIGSVYETMMGFRLETATGSSVAIKAQKKHGAPTAVDLEALLSEPAAKREKWLQDRADRKLTDTVNRAAAEAATVEDLHAALLPVIDLNATPDLAPRGAMVLQPSEERRRSGSHYTPRALTEPIVRTTLAPILTRLRGPEDRPPMPKQILELRVCDPAMGSGAFLVEACRQLGDALIEAWNSHGEKPPIPPDEDEVIFARRLIAQRCLYGVDKNPVAVDLAKVSLWLVTLARDHALTFVDHALRHGDSLVGLSRKQIEAFHWDPIVQRPSSQLSDQLREQVAKVTGLRRQIRDADESVSDSERRDLWDEAQFELGKVRLYGDLVTAAFFEGEKPSDRERMRSKFVNAVVSGEADRYRGWLEEWRDADPPLAPFHWEIEFPEVFDREGAGFDALVGNPPFLGGRLIAIVYGDAYTPIIKTLTHTPKAAADLSAYFFARAAALRAPSGTIGFVATKALSEGDTRQVLAYVLDKWSLAIYNAQTSRPWPGEAGTHFITLSLRDAAECNSAILDDVRVERINTRLSSEREICEPTELTAVVPASKGVTLIGGGFLLTEAEHTQLLAADPACADVVKQLVTADDLANQPDLRLTRWCIDFGERSEQEAARFRPAFARIVELVKPQRERLTRQIHEEAYWKHWDKRTVFFQAVMRIGRALVIPRVAKYVTVVVVDGTASKVFADSVIAVASESWELFAVLQARIHELWAKRFSSSRGVTMIYNVGPCFRTFPFPETLGTDSRLESAGAQYYEFRCGLMIRNRQGLTKTYNRFHDPDERDPQILRLRELHAAMDRAVLDAYGWSDIPADCEFLLDHEIDDEDWGDKMRPYRYRWPDEVRDEVLARLLELNARRAQEEARAGVTEAKKRHRTPRAKPAAKPSEAEDLFS